MSQTGVLPSRVRAFQAVAGTPNLRLLLFSFFVFNVAEYATWVAVMVYAYRVGGATGAGVAAVIQLIPAGIFAPFAAVAADRVPPVRALSLGYAIQAASMGAGAAALGGGAPVPLAYLAVAVAAMCITLTRPAYGAVLPFVSRSTSELMSANAASTMAGSASILAGPALAGALLAFAGPGSVYALMAVLLLLAAAAAGRVRVTRRASAAAPADVGSGRLLSESFAGFTELGTRGRPRLLIALAATDALLVGALDVLFVVISLELLHTGEPGVGFLEAAFGVGSVGAALLVLRVRRLQPGQMLWAGLVLLGGPLAAFGLAPARALAFGLLVFVGAGHALVDVSSRTLLQRVVRSGVLARILGVLEGLIMVMLAGGSILAPGLTAWLGLRGAVAVLGLPAVAAGALSSRALTRLDREAIAPIEAVALLRRFSPFALFGPQTLELVALQMRRLAFGPAAEIVREGDPGADCFFIETGEVLVSANGREAARLGPGDYFGEIALLMDVPRTATVAALTPVTLYALGRKPFLTIISGPGGPRPLVERRAAERWMETREILRQA